MLLGKLVRYALRFCWAPMLSKAVLSACLLAAESQLAAQLSRSHSKRTQRRRFSPAFRILWVALSKFLEGWEDLVHLMKPETVKGMAHQGSPHLLALAVGTPTRRA